MSDAAHETKKNTFSGRIFWFLCIFITVVFCVANIVCCAVFAGIASKTALTSNKNYLANFSVNLTSMMHKITALANEFLMDSTINEYVYEYPVYKQERHYLANILERNIGGEMTNFMNLNQGISGLQLVMKDYQIARNNIDFSFASHTDKYNYLTGVMEGASTLVIRNTAPQNGEIEGMLSMSGLQLIGIGKDQREPWYLVISLDPSFLLGNNDVDVVDVDGTVVLESAAGIGSGYIDQLLSQSENQRAGSFLYSAGEGAYSVYFNTAAGDNDWIYARVIRGDNVAGLTARVAAFSLGLSAALVALALFVGWAASKRLARPIYELSRNVKNIHDFERDKPAGGTRRFSGYWLSRWGFKRKVMVYFTLLTLVPATIYICGMLLFANNMSYGFFEGIMAENIEMIQTNVKQETANIKQISRYLATNPEIQKILGTGETPVLTEGVSRIIISEDFLKGNINTIELMDDGLNIVYSTNSNNESVSDIEAGMIDEFNRRNAYEMWMYSNYIETEGYQIPYIRRVWKYDAQTVQITNSGYIFINMDESNIDGIIRDNQVMFTGESTIVNSDGKTVYRQDKNEETKYAYNDRGAKMIEESSKVLLSENGDTLIFRAYFDDEPWVLITSVPKSELHEYLFDLGYALLVLMLVLCLMTFYLADYFAGVMLRPIYTIKKGIEEIELGNLKEMKFIGPEDDLQEISDDIYKMLSNTDKLLNEIYSGKLRTNELEARKKEAELISLQCQINPHFLYNTFTTIKFLVDLGELNNAKKMITALGKLFRQSVYRGQFIVSVKEEIEHAQSYVEIQQMRYGDSLKVEWSLDERIFEYNTLKFLLQPLVENAIQYGVEGSGEVNVITINGFLKDEALIFEVIDYGLGLTPERLEKLKKQINGEIESDRVGIKNINERIKLYCGQQYGIEIESEINVQTCFRVKLNLMK